MRDCCLLPRHEPVTEVPDEGAGDVARDPETDHGDDDPREVAALVGVPHEEAEAAVTRRPVPRPRSGSAATTTSQVIPMPTDAPVTSEGNVAGRITRAEQHPPVRAHRPGRPQVARVDLVGTAHGVDDDREERHPGR